MKAMLMSAPFALMGVIALAMLLHDGILGGLTKDSAIKLSSVVVVAIGFVVLIFGIVAKKTSLAEQLKASLAEDSEKPWLKRPDWAAGRIKSAGIPDARAYLIMGIVLCVLGTIIAILLVSVALRTRSYSNLVGLLFPLVGIAFLLSVVKKIVAHRQFGDCIFEMAKVPASPGGALQGAIRTTRPMRPGRPLQLQVSCLRRTVGGAGQHRRAEEKILWEDAQTVKAAADSAAGGNVPVLFELPPGQPESSRFGNPATLWRLEAKITEMNFHASFEVPVFRIADTPATNT
ncbi:MAG: hypothetical protein ACLQSR_04295 [Limisphaerales bacterium]